MKVLKGIGFFIAIIVAVYVVLGLIGPSEYKVSRSIKIEAPVDVIFDQTSKFENWGAWSPWAKIATDTKYTIENDNQEVGAKMSWESNHEKVGHGSMTIDEIVKNEKVLYTLAFIKPWEMSSKGGFIYVQEENVTNVEWYDSGDIPFAQRPMMLFMDLEEMIGPMFEKGLADIKTICEKIAEKPAMEITKVMVEAQPILFISESSSLIPSEMEAKLGGAFGEIMALMSVAQVEMTAPPMSITTMFSVEEMKCEFDAAIVAELPEGVEVSGRIQKGETYAGKVLKTVHTGSYANLKATYDEIIAYIEANSYEINGNSWEVYVDDPSIIAEEKLRTNIYFPVK